MAGDDKHKHGVTIRTDPKTITPPNPHGKTEILVPPYEASLKHAVAALKAGDNVGFMKDMQAIALDAPMSFTDEGLPHEPKDFVAALGKADRAMVAEIKNMLQTFGKPRTRERLDNITDIEKGIVSDLAKKPYTSESLDSDTYKSHTALVTLQALLTYDNIPDGTNVNPEPFYSSVAQEILKHAKSASKRK